MRLWDLTTAEELACFHYDSCVYCITFAIDSQSTAQCFLTKSGREFCKRNLETHEIIFDVKLPHDSVDLCVCLEGRLVLTVDVRNGNILALDGTNGLR